MCVPGSADVRPVQHLRQELSLGDLAGVRAITVANFPMGRATPSVLMWQVGRLCRAGADEVEVAFPFEGFLENRLKQVREILDAARTAAVGVSLTVVLDEHTLRKPDIFRSAIRMLVEIRVDWIKLVVANPSRTILPDAVYRLLDVLREEGRPTGLKVAGLIQGCDQAIAFFAAVSGAWGEDWLTPDRVRLSSSPSLLDALESIPSETTGASHFLGKISWFPSR